jgi:hypothetical protein
MRKNICCIAVLIIILFSLPVCLQAGQTATDEQVYFSPKGGCTEAIVKNLDQAERYVLVQAYSFTSKPIAEALVNAHKLRTALNFFHPARRTSSSYRGELLPPSAANFFHFVTPPATV